MNTYFIKFLNQNGAETTIRFSTHTKQFYVSSSIEIKDGIFLRGITEHRDTVEEAVSAFNEAIQGKLLVINSNSQNWREILIPKL